MMKNGVVVRLVNDRKVSEFMCKGLVCFGVMVDVLSKNRCHRCW